MRNVAPGYELALLESSRRIIEAEERLKAGEVSDAELYDVVLLATGEVKAAEDALYYRARARVMHGQKFEG